MKIPVQGLIARSKFSSIKLIDDGKKVHLRVHRARATFCGVYPGEYNYQSRTQGTYTSHVKVGEKVVTCDKCIEVSRVVDKLLPLLKGEGDNAQARYDFTRLIKNAHRAADALSWVGNPKEREYRIAIQ